MAAIVYLLCALTSIACAVLLIRGYRRSRSHLLLWSALCFVGLAAENVILFADLILLPGVDLHRLRLLVGFTAVLLLLTGLIWESS